MPWARLWLLCLTSYLVHVFKIIQISQQITSQEPVCHVRCRGPGSWWWKGWRKRRANATVAITVASPLFSPLVPANWLAAERLAAEQVCAASTSDAATASRIAIAWHFHDVIRWISRTAFGNWVNRLVGYALQVSQWLLLSYNSVKSLIFIHMVIDTEDSILFFQHTMFRV